MRKLLLIVLLLLLIAACRNGGSSEDTGTNETAGVSTGEETPRIENTPVPPTPTSLPATATPLPEFVPEHVYPATKRTIHIIQPGDTLSEIALQYGVTVDAISDANRHYNFDLIYAGDWIYIPECEPERVVGLGNLVPPAGSSTTDGTTNSTSGDATATP